MPETRGLQPGDIQPVANETRDRIITGLVTVGPLRRPLRRRLAGLGVGSALVRHLPVPRHVLLHRARDHGRLPPSPHPPQLQDLRLAARAARDPRLGGDRGPGHLLGRRPPQAPHLLRQGGRPAQPPRRPRPRLERRPARPRPRPRRLDLHPHPARQQGALRAGPARRTRSSPGSTAPSSSGRSSGCCCPSRSAGRSAAPLFAGLTGLLWGGLVRVFVLHHFTYSINSLCHFFGRRDFDTDDQSRNLALIAIPTLGEAFHNSHHAFPTSATHGLGRWQLDISALVIDGLEKVDLAWDVVRVSPRAPRRQGDLGRLAARFRAGAAVRGPSRASRGGPGRLWPPRDARDVSEFTPGRSHGGRHVRNPSVRTSCRRAERRSP